MKFISSVVILTLSLNLWSQEGRRPYPMGPDSRLTPGKLCDRPTERRYPENIAYCERSVSSDQKQQVFDDYNRYLGYIFRDSNRSSFKIDHFIPLCAGGSNDQDNLWPQHISIYSQTDKLEELACLKLSEGKIKQKDLVSLIKETKRNLSVLPQTLRRLNSL